MVGLCPKFVEQMLSYFLTDYNEICYAWFIPSASVPNFCLAWFTVNRVMCPWAYIYGEAYFNIISGSSNCTPLCSKSYCVICHCLRLTIRLLYMCNQLQLFEFRRKNVYKQLQKQKVRLNIPQKRGLLDYKCIEIRPGRKSSITSAHNCFLKVGLSLSQSGEACFNWKKSYLKEHLNWVLILSKM